MTSGRLPCFPGMVVYLIVALGCPLSQGHHLVQARCNDRISLPCSLTVNTSNYRYVAWYKVNTGSKAGIIRKNLSKNGDIQRYNYLRETSLGDSEALVLERVSPEDSGVYECMLGAHIGEKNHILNVDLNVSECVITPSPTPALVNMTRNFCQSGHTLVELSPAKVFSGFSVLGIVKALLCLLSMWVFFKVKKKE